MVMLKKVIHSMILFICHSDVFYFTEVIQFCFESFIEWHFHGFELVVVSIWYWNVVNVNLNLGGPLLDWLQYWGPYWRVCEDLREWTVLPDWWWREGKNENELADDLYSIRETGLDVTEAFI